MTLLRENAPFWLLFAIALLAAVTLAAGGWWPLLVPVFVFVVVPAGDALFGRDQHDLGPHQWWHDLPLWAWVPLQLGLVAWLAATAGGRTLTELAIATFAVGLLAGAGGITIAHELVHRKGRRERALAELLMTAVNYPWFCVEHVLGHHRNVGTARDPATSRLGESLYAFLPRTLLGSFTSFWSVERDYAGRRGIPPWDLRDRRLRYLVSLAALHVLVLAATGPWGWAVFVGQSVVAVLLLEVVNYVEHYGLLRREVAPGEFERVRPHHSWNSTMWLSGAFLFHLPRHADHHAFASRPYHELRAWPDSPELPWGYATAVLVAFVPPVWRRVMDPRVVAARAASRCQPQL